jgi:hypothetical protein
MTMLARNRKAQARTATAIVAASDAPEKWKVGADYICDGTADDVQIQAAIDTDDDKNTTVTLSPGTFNLAAAVIVGYGTRLIGQGQASTIIAVAGSHNAIESKSSGVVDYRVARGCLQGFRLDGPGVGGSESGIYLPPNADSTWTEPDTDPAFAADSVNRWVIEDVHAYGWDIGFNLDALAAPGAVTIYIVRCTTVWCNTGVYGGGSQIRIFQCSFQQSTDFNIDLTGNKGVIRDNHILDPFEQTTARAIRVQGSNFIISGNLIDGDMKHGIVVHGDENVVSENIILSTQEYGIFLGASGSSVSSDRNIIANNYIENVGSSDSATNTGGIRIDHGADNIIADNIIANPDANQEDGIALGGGASSVVTGTHIIGNKIIGATYGRDLIRIDTGTTLSGTVIEQNDLSGTATGNKITDNGTGTVIKGNTGYVTENSGTATVANGATTAVVTHGLATTPTRVIVTARTWSNAAKASVGTLTSTQFTITVDSDPGAGTAVFDWKAQVGEG